MGRREPLPLDYDTNPGRFRSGRNVTESFSLLGDVHDVLAPWLSMPALAPVLDLGCGDGKLVTILRARGAPVVGCDVSAVLLAGVAPPVVRGDAVALPFGAESFGSVAAFYMLYHLAEPRAALIEIRRVLRPTGRLFAVTTSRFNDPELDDIVPRSPTTFDAEEGPDIVRSVFDVVEVARWDAPLVRLPDRAAIRAYLIGQRLEPDHAATAAERLAAPLVLTKRGAIISAIR